MDKLEEIEALLASATDAPCVWCEWCKEEFGDREDCTCKVTGPGIDIPWLIAEVKRLRADNALLSIAAGHEDACRHKWVRAPGPDRVHCSGCGKIGTYL